MKIALIKSINRHQAPLLVAFTAMVLGLGINAVANPSLPVLDPPRISEQRAARAIALRMDPIEDFEHYYGAYGEPWRNNDPFIPWQARKKKRNILDSEEKVDQPVDQPMDLPPAPERQPAPKAPRLPDVPPARSDSVVIPQVVGFIRAPAGSMVHVRFGGGESVVMREGMVAQGWTLLRARAGFATFRDAEGYDHQFPVGGPAGESVDVGDQPRDVPQQAAPVSESDEDTAAALVKLIEADPRGAELLRRRPELRRVFLSDAEAARMAVRQLGINASSVGSGSSQQRSP